MLENGSNGTTFEKVQIADLQVDDNGNGCVLMGRQEHWIVKFCKRNIWVVTVGVVSIIAALAVAWAQLKPLPGKVGQLETQFNQHSLLQHIRDSLDDVHNRRQSRMLYSIARRVGASVIPGDSTD